MITLKKFASYSALLFPLSLLLGTVAHSAVFRVSPIRVYMEPRAKITSVTVSNDSDKKVTIQVRVKSWDQDEQGREIVEETRDLIAFPKIFTLDKGGTRVVRISLRGPPATTRERTYRLYIREVPVIEPGVTAVRFALQMSLPVFIQPLREIRQWSVEKVELEKGGVRVAVLNEGNGHILVNQITAIGLDAKGSELFSQKTSGWYVLRGKVKHFVVSLPQEICLQLHRIKVTVNTTKKSKETEVEVIPDPSRCTPPAVERKDRTGKRQ